MSIRYPIPHSHPGRPVKRWSRPLPELVQARVDFASFSKKNKALQPMLALYEQLISSGGEELFGSGIMGGGMVLAARQDVAHNEGVIVVEFDPRKSLFSLSYRNWEVEPEHVERCSVSDVWERLRLFVGYKLGVRLKKTPNQAPEPTRSARGSS